MAEENEANDDAPGYEFEILVFRCIDKGAGATEARPDNPGATSLENAISFDIQGSTTLHHNLPIPYRQLPVGEPTGTRRRSTLESRNWAIGYVAVGLSPTLPP